MTSTPNTDFAPSVYGHFIAVLPTPGKSMAENRTTDSLYHAMQLIASHPHRADAYIVDGDKRSVGFYDAERGIVPCHSATGAERALILSTGTLLSARMW